MVLKQPIIKILILEYPIFQQTIKSSYHNPSKKQWYNIPLYYSDTDVYIHKDNLNQRPEIVDVNQQITNDDLIKIVENGKPVVGGLNTIYAVANYDTPLGRGIIPQSHLVLPHQNYCQNMQYQSTHTKVKMFLLFNTVKMIISYL